jgi:hypothetical protein
MGAGLMGIEMSTPFFNPILHQSILTENRTSKVTDALAFY